MNIFATLLGLLSMSVNMELEKKCFKLTTYLGLCIRLSHNYLMFVQGMGKFGVAQTSCTNRRNQTV